MSKGLLRSVIKEIISRSLLVEAIKNDDETRAALAKVANETLAHVAEQHLAPAFRVGGWSFGIDESAKSINVWSEKERLVNQKADEYQRLFDGAWLEHVALNQLRPTDQELKAHVVSWFKDAFIKEFQSRIEPGWTVKMQGMISLPAKLVRANFEHEMRELGVKVARPKELVDTGGSDPLDFTTLGMKDVSTKRHKSNNTRVWEDPESLTQVFIRPNFDMTAMRVLLKLPQWSAANERGEYTDPKDVRARVIELMKRAREQASTGSTLIFGPEMNGINVAVVSVSREQQGDVDQLVNMQKAIKGPWRVWNLTPGSSRKETLTASNIERPLSERLLEIQFSLLDNRRISRVEFLFAPNVGASLAELPAALLVDPQYPFTGDIIEYVVSVTLGRVELRRKSVA